MRLRVAMMCAALTPIAWGQNLDVNGGFEQGAFPGGQFLGLPANSTTITGWLVGPEGGVRWYDWYTVNCLEGRKSLELNEQSPSSISQSVPTNPGTSYRLRFMLAGDPYGLAAFRTLRVHVGPLSFDYEFVITGCTYSSMGWRDEAIEFVASSTNTLLRFESTSPLFAGPFIDAVSMEAITPVCVADVDDGTGTGTRDGGVTVDDLLYYLFIFEAGATPADVDDGSGTGTPDGGVTIDDLLYFLLRFELGC